MTKWRKRFAENRLDGLLDEPRPGAVRTVSDDTVEQIVTDTLETAPKDATHWSTRSMAERHGISRQTVSKIWRAFGLKPWEIDVFKVSPDPQLVEKIRDIVGLYMNPPVNAAVFAVDEKPQIQALNRTAPMLPMLHTTIQRCSHDYKRNGTIDLFAAMNIATGQVLTGLQKRHAATDVLRFFKQIDASVPPDLAVHVVLDNLSAHRAPEITKWLDHPDRQRWHLHFTPTSSSWMNLIERWFKELTDKRLRRGRFTSVAELTDAITTWAEHWNADPKPFIWKATAEEIIAKVQRGRAALHQINSTTDH